MSDVRCPSCAAHVAPAAAWCGQCYASLVTEPVKPPRPPVTSGTALQVVAGGAVAVLGELPPPPPGPPGAIPPPPPPPAAASEALSVGKPPWPCMRCETVNPYTANSCTACGLGFLDSLSEPSDRLPLLGDLRDIGRGTKVKIGLGVSFGLCLVLLVVFTVAGLVLG